MSLSRLERLQEQAEEERIAKLRAKMKVDTTDETKRAKKIMEEEAEQTRFCFKALEDNIWYYRDRAGLPRGPCPLSVMRACWVNGIVDHNTLVWGQGLEAWYPVSNVVGLIANIQTFDVLLFKWMHDKLILNPRLESIRNARKDFLKGARSGRIQLDPSEAERLKEEAKGLALKAQPHPVVRWFALKTAELDAAQSSPAAPAAAAAAKAARPAAMAACLSMALPLPKGLKQELRKMQRGEEAL